MLDENYDVNNEKPTRRGITASTIKIMAIIIMAIDHTSAAVLTRILIDRGMYDILTTDMDAQINWLAANGPLYYTMLIMRGIGRLAFPIFCYFIVEGFQHTRDVKKYALRLFAFALISEVPFDLALAGTAWYPSYQNVYWTLLLGLIAIYFIDYVTKLDYSRFKNLTLENIVRTLGIVCAAAIPMVVAHFLNTDYGAMGVMVIAVMYLLRKKPLLAYVAGVFILSLMSLVEILAILMVIPLYFYNGKRGLKMKYFFYWFYPVHLLILWLICYAMGLGWVSTM